MLKVSNNITATIINELFKICFHSFNIHSKSNFVVPVVHTIHRSSHIEVLLVKGVLKIRSKFTGEHPCRSNFIEITLRHGCSPVYLLHIFRTPFHRAPLGGCFCIHNGPNPIQHLQSPYLKYDTGLRKRFTSFDWKPINCTCCLFKKNLYQI